MVRATPRFGIETNHLGWAIDPDMIKYCVGISGLVISRRGIDDLGEVVGDDLVNNLRPEVGVLRSGVVASPGHKINVEIPQDNYLTPWKLSPMWQRNHPIAYVGLQWWFDFHCPPFVRTPYKIDQL